MPTSRPDETDSRPTPAVDAGSCRHLDTDLMPVVCESIPIGLVVFSRGLDILLSNQAARAILPAAADLGAALSGLVVESGYQDWETELRRVLDTGVPVRSDVTVPGQGDAASSFLSLTVSPIPEGPGRPAAMGILLIENITARISMERRLAVSERLAAVGKLAARVAHELNNPLDGILRYTNLAIRCAGEGGDPRIGQYLEKARSGILRMGEIIATLLEFSRSTPCTFEQATINKIVEDAISAMEGRAGDSRVTFVCNFQQADIPVVRGSSIFQVFCNLIKNAIDAMPEGGTLTITTAVVGPDVVVRFEDTGIGLPDDIEKLFEPFFTTKAPGKGTGLGLAVCRELMEKQGGTIHAERRVPQGAAFTVRLPLRSCSPATPGRSLGGLERDREAAVAAVQRPE